FTVAYTIVFGTGAEPDSRTSKGSESAILKSYLVYPAPLDGSRDDIPLRWARSVIMMAGLYSGVALCRHVPARMSQSVTLELYILQRPVYIPGQFYQTR